MSSSPYRRIIPREETIGQEIGKHWRIDRPYPSPIFQSGRGGIIFHSSIDLHRAFNYRPRRLSYTRVPIERSWSIVVCTFADCSTPLPASPPLPYFSWTEVQFHEEGRLLFYRIIRLQWVMIFISFPSILWMKYYNNYLVHLSNMHHTIWSFLEEQV